MLSGSVKVKRWLKVNHFYSPWNYQKRFSEDSRENKIRLILEVEFDDDRQQFWVGWSETEMLNTEWETEKDKSDEEHKIISKNRLKGKKTSEVYLDFWQAQFGIYNRKWEKKLSSFSTLQVRMHTKRTQKNSSLHQIR